MADIDCNSEMTGFHGKEVTLSKSEQDDMRRRRNSGRIRLESGLNLTKYPQPKEMASQGSYQMRTMVQDEDCDYDIDDGAYFKKEDLVDEAGKYLTPLAARERVCDGLTWDGRLKHEATIKTNCVRQEYPEGYHIDVPIYRLVTVRDDEGDEAEHYELASGDEWVKSDARAVTSWYNGLVGELNTGQDDGSQMRRVTKLTKKLARSRSDWKKKTTTGICITKLIADHIVPVMDRDDKALRETWKIIKQALDTSTQIKHPVQVDVNLAESGDSEVEFFRECLRDVLKKLEVLDAQYCSRKQAKEAWDNVFATTYFSDRSDPDDDGGKGGGGDGGGKSASVVVTSGQTARRNDGGGRFG